MAVVLYKIEGLAMVTGFESAVKLMGVAKRYDDVVTVDYVDLDVKDGEIFVWNK